MCRVEQHYQVGGIESEVGWGEVRRECVQGWARVQGGGRGGGERVGVCQCVQ